MRVASLIVVGVAGVVGLGVVGCSSSANTQGPLFPPSRTTPDSVATSAPVSTTTATKTATTAIATTIVTTTSTLVLPTPTTLPLITGGGVIKVANATGVEEAAERLTDQLGVLGFSVDDPTNAAGKDEELAVSKIYVKAGSEAVAESISYLMGGIDVLRMPTPAWISGGTAALGDTTVLVMLGSDLASSPLLVMRFEPGRQGPD